MRLVHQSSLGECAAACLATIAGYYSAGWDLQRIRQLVRGGTRGTSLELVVQLSAKCGFSARPLRLEVGELRELRVPCILHWDLNHFVVLSEVGRRHAKILDPAVGERRMRMEEVSRHFTGVALELTPNAEFQPQSAAPRLRISQLTGKVHGLSSSLLQIFAVAATLQLFALVAPLFSQLVVDEVITSGDHDMLTVLVLGFGLLLVVQTALGLARSWMVMVLGQSLSLQWAGNVFAHLLRLPVDYFEQRHLGDVGSRFGSIGAIQRTLTTAAIEAVLDGVLAVAALVMMLIYSPTLAGVVVAAVAAYGLLRWAAYRPLRDASAERLVIAARENTHFLETLRAITPLKLFGRESGRLARWQNLLVDVQNRDVRTAKLNIAFGTANTFIFGLENLLVLWLGAKAVMAGPGNTGGMLTVGMLFAFMAYKAQFSGRVSALINYTVEFKMLGLHAERLADIALTAPERDNPKADGPAAQVPPNDLSHLRPSLELRDVSFRYGEGETWVLRHANLKIEAGEIVAVTGASGCGKSTLLKLLLGLLQPNEGEVLYGGIPVRQLGLANVRRQLGTVMQEDVLLTGSLADNIAFFDEQPDQPRIEACSRIAQVHDDIVRMPMGYHTLVGDLGHGLSGGQKQRILLARALYKQPRVLALDEATSHLDLANERAVTQALARMRLTRLVIAHRPETIAGAQRVVQLKDGQVQELVRQVRPSGETPESIAAETGLSPA